MDLDQAMYLERAGDGYLVHYAIADVGAVVAPGAALDREVRRRGQTFYLPDGSVPLHPPALAEDAASLLPDGPRAAVLWRIDLDGGGEPTAVDVRRAVVRSRARLDYAGVQADLDAGRPTTRRWSRCPTWAGCGGRSPCAAARSSWSCPSRRSSPPAAAGGPSGCAAGSTSRRGTRRCPCSPARAPPG